MHYKLMVFGIAMVAVVVFGLLFWNNLIFNQQEIANTPLGGYSSDSQVMMPEGESSLSKSDSYDALEADLNATDVNGVDSNNAQLESELSGL